MMDYAIIVAGGKGLRMGGDVPKQFMLLRGKPVLMHTLERFHDYNPALGLIVVLPREQQPYWQQLCHEHRFVLPHRVADGGHSRWASSRNGLALIPDEAKGVVAIHDGVRPFVSTEVIGRCYETARSQGTCIPVLPVNDTLRYTEPGGSSHNVLRDHYRIVQTPQTFRIPILKEAFRQPESDRFTDDASVVEAMGLPVATTEGNRENIKLTTPFDRVLAEALLSYEEPHK